MQIATNLSVMLCCTIIITKNPELIEDLKPDEGENPEEDGTN